MLKPVDTWLTAIREEQAEKSSGGIYLPHQGRTDKKVALVVAVGPKVTMCQPGDKVVFGRYAGDEYEHQGKSYMLIKEDELMAVQVDEETR